MVIARLLRALRRRSAPALQRLYNLRYWGLLTVFVFVTSVGVFYTRASAPTRVYAATSSTLNFQGRLLNSNGSLISDTSTAQIRFKIYDGGTQGGPAGTGQANSGTGGTFLWSEVQSNIRIVNGYFSVNLGSQTAFPNTIDWSQELWLTMDVYNGAAYDGEMTNANLRMKLTAVPYAFRAGQADSLTDGTSSITAANLLQKAPVTIQTVNAGVAGLRFNQTGAGGLIQIQADSSDIFTVSKTGNAFLGGLLNIDGASLDIGSNSLAGTLILNDGSNNTGSVLTAALSANRTYTLPDSDGVICLTTTCAGGANGFIQGGNSFGGLATLGTNDNFDLNFETNGITKLTVSTAGDLTFAQGANRTLSVAQASSGTGNNLTIVAGQSSTGANNGGNLILQAGASGGSGSTGSVIVKANGTDSATAFQIQRAAATDVLTVDTANSTTLLRGINSSASLGANLITSQDFTDTTYWSCSGWTTTTSDATHNTGNTTACSVTATNMTVVAGTTYFIEFMLDGNSSAENTVTPSIGGVSGVPIGQIGMNSHSVTINAGNTSALTFTPTNSFNGTISNIVVRAITTTKPVLQVKNSGGTVSMEIRASNITSNSFIGLRAGLSNTTGFDNTALGTGALQGNTTGYENTAIGASALFNNTTGSDNTALGAYALYSNTTGNQNLALGPYALYGNTTGFENIAIGQSALLNNTTGYYNTALGSRALGDNTTGSNNIAIGYYALMYNTTGYGNTVIGDSAGFQDPSVSSFVTPGNLSNATALGYGAQVQASNSLILGGQGTNAVNVGIGTTVPKNTLSVSPLQYSTGTVSQSGTTITGTGTTFTSAMVGGELIFASGNKVTITGFTNATTLTVTPSQTIVEQAYRIHYVGLQVTNSGNVGIGVLNPLARLEVTASNGGSQKTLVVNNSTSTGNILEVQDNGTPVFTIADGGLVALTQLGSADNNTVLCRNAANQIATCTNNFATTTSAFVQGGNSFGAEAVLGTNDNNALSFETNGTTKLTILANGNVGIGTSGTPAALLSIGGSTGNLTIDSSGNLTTSGTYNTNTFSATNLTFGGASGTISTTSNGNLTLAPNGSGVLGLNTGSTGLLTTNASTIRRTATGTTTFDLLDSGDTTLAFTNSGAGVLNLTVDGNGTFATGLTVSAGGASLTGGLNNNSGNITNAGSITGVGANITGTGALTLASGGSGALTLDSASNILVLADDTLQRASSGLTIDVNNAGLSTLNIANNNGSNLANLDVEGGIFAGTGNAFTVNSDGDVIAAFTLLNGTSTTNGAALVASTSLVLNDASNFDVGNYVQVNSTNCGGTGVNVCYAKITAKATNTLTITPALTWANASTVNEYHVPELGGTNTGSTLASRYGRGYFIAGVATGNGTTYYNEDSITTSLTNFNLLNTGATTLNIGGAATSLNLGASGGTVTIAGNITVNGVISGAGPSSGTSGFFTRSGTTLSTANAGDSLSITGTLSGLSGLTVSSGGASITGGLNNNSGGITSAGSIAGATTLSLSGAITGATATNTINGLVVNSGALSSVTGITFTSGGLNLNNGGIINAGSLTGVGANITATAGLTIASGGSAALTLDSASNTLLIAGTDTAIQRTATGTLTIDLADAGVTTLALNNTLAGAASLNLVDGGLQVAGTSVLTNGRALQNLTGLTVASGGANITGNSTIVGTLGSITTLTAQTINATTSYQINGTAGTSRTCANNQFVGGQTITNGITTATNNCTAPALSDERVKENVASIDTAVLDRLKNVRAVTFDFKCNNPLYENAGMDCYSGRQTGVIAQEIAQIFPDLVYQDSNGYYNVKYQGLSIYTLKAVSELAARVDSIGSGNGGNANEVSTGGVLRLDANGALQNINGLNMTGGSASIIGGLNLNGSGINNAGEIKGVTNIFATSLTLNASGNQNLLTLFKDGNEVFTIFNDGALRIRTNSTRSFAIESADGRTHFNVDTFGNLVSIGSQNGDDKAILFALDTKNTAGDPTGVNGASYYNSDAGKFRCFQDGRWQDCLPAAYAEYVLLATQAKWQQPQGESEFSGEPRTWVDLSSAREFRMIMRVTQAAPNGTTCKLQFATTEDGPWADLFEGDANLKTDTTGSLKTDWKRIREDARTEVILRVMCSSAQTNSNPELGGIRIQLR
jgi:hypothetical protein